MKPWENGAATYSGVAMADVTGRQGERCDAQYGQGDDLQRREEAPNGIQQTARIQRDEEHQQEVHRAVEEQRQRALAGQRRQAHLEGYRRGTWRREQRAHGQVACRRQQTTGDFTDRAAQGIHCTADLGQRHNGDHRQTNRGDQETQRRHPDIEARTANRR